jgi:hypothetical protein
LLGRGPFPIIFQKEDRAMGELPLYGRLKGVGRHIIGVAIVDDDILPELRKYTWSVSGDNNAFRWNPETRSSQYLHYFIWEYHNGIDSVPESGYLDHRNMDKRDYRLENLMLVDGSEKQANAPKHSDNTSGYKDVFLKPNGRFEAMVKKDNKTHYCGRYATLEQAAFAVNLAYQHLYPKLPVPNDLPVDALSEAQEINVLENVERLLREDRAPKQR